MESKYYRNLTRLTRYVIVINAQIQFDVQLSISKHNLLLQLWDDKENVMHIEESIHELDKIDEDVLVEKVSEICDKLDRYRIK